MSIPQSCTTLVIGGGPAGSYASACLAREGVDTVLLEADSSPRYHIGDDTLPSLRQFLRFIGLDDGLNAYGFFKKIGDVFRLNQSRPDVCTNALNNGGPNAHARNVLPSESDDLLFRHAKACGARVFDQTKVETIRFEQGAGEKVHSLGAPSSAAWRHRDGAEGSIKFKYLIDASGRNSIVSTKHLEKRTFNQNFKNVANWAYWKTGKVYGPGTHIETAPRFEALKDASGWCWYMPLHDGIRSVGVVQDQKLATEKRRAQGIPSTLNFYKSIMHLAPEIFELLKDAELVTDVRFASDYSYMASTYHMPNTRICGDAGAFSDPPFSSGIHFAITGGLSAALTITSSLRGDLCEETAGDWHSKKTVESYTRLFGPVRSAYKQIRSWQQEAYPPEQAIVADLHHEGLQRAFDLFLNVVQGDTDAVECGEMSQGDVSNIVDFCFKASNYVPTERRETVLVKLQSLGIDSQSSDISVKEVKSMLTAEELGVMETLHSRRKIRDDQSEVEAFPLGTIDGFRPNLQRGKLGLVHAQTTAIK